jgi:DMSO reductase anchor subunit
MKPAWSVILLTTLIGAGQGLFLTVFAVSATRPVPPQFVTLGCWVTLAFLAAGLFASFFHLGRPERAWRAVTQWRTSWLSREVIVLPAFMGCVFLFLVTKSLAFGALAAILCLALYVCTGMIYACLRFLQEWATWLTPLNFLLLGLASGLALSVPIAVLSYGQFAGPLALAAFGVGASAWLVRCATLVRNARLKPKSTAASAIGIPSPRIAQRSQGFTGSAYNTRDFFPGRPKPVVGLVRWLFVVLVFPLPAWLLGWGSGSFENFCTAFALQFAGLVAERWYFFAEARHPQNLYYQAKS